MRQALEVFQKQKARDDETQAWCILARALLAEDKAAAATEAMEHARSLAGKSQNPEIRWRTAITAARIEIAENETCHAPLPGLRHGKNWPPSSRNRENWVIGVSNWMLGLRSLKSK